MLQDAQLIFSDAQSVTVSAPSTNFINQVIKGDAYGSELYLVCRVAEKFTGATSMQISIETDDENNFINPKTLLSSSSILEADLSLNTFAFTTRMPKGLLKYYRLYYTVVGIHGTGKLDAFLTTEVPQRI
jgi:hypothetical protein